MKYIIFYFDYTASKMFVEKTDESGTASMVLSSPYNFASKDEIVAKVIDIDNTDDAPGHIDKSYPYYKILKYIPVKAGEGITYDQLNSVFKADDYGFVKFDRDKSSILLLSPLRIQKDKMKAFYIIHPTNKKHIPTVQSIEENLIKLKIYTMVDKTALAGELEQIDINVPQMHRIKVAQGKDVKNGYDEYFIPLIDFEKKAGKILEDGSIDFKEIGSIVEIKQRQAILKKIPAQAPEDGFDIYGQKTQGQIVQPDGFKLGENIVPTVDPEIYASTIDGCLEINQKTVSVSPISLVKGDVSYESGNIDFHGSVHIKGSVLPGFTVKAKGDVIVGQNVSDALIQADGDITIKLGIEGTGKTNVIAGGKVKAKFITNSNVEAMGQIQVEDSIINSNIFSNDKIFVTDKHGKIIGGETTALYEIQAKISGVPNENKTVLSVGKNIILEKELLEIKNKILPVKDKIDEITQKLKSSFGEEIFTNPKGLIAILPPVKKKNCIGLLSELTANNSEFKKLKEEYQEKENGLNFDHEPTIEITNKVYPGTLIKIKKSLRMIEEELHNVKFYEDAETKEIRFTSAV